MAHVHHVSWHLLRQYKGKLRTRVYRPAAIGAMHRKSEALSIQFDAQLARAKQVEADTQTLYVAMQSAQVKAEG